MEPIKQHIYTRTTHRVKNNRYNTKIQKNSGSEKCPTKDKKQIGLRVLKITRGTISLPRPSLAGGIPKLTSSDFKPVGCIGIAAP